ncbi:SEC-C metal-binding domain-containing protein [Bacillus andreraoultii]|uniref:SEC-C metal-binding domain-containing protein n=1 Tax=Bacillus andreraoultii TaxID=1499685 RepID=UPI00067F1F46|nr:SEC-C metal-binding domain-containing protein [Bacillus andreraoultii]
MNIVMDKPINKDTKTLIDKENKKLWTDTTLPLSLHDGLSKLTKNELDTIRKKLHIPNASGLNKGQLINVLADKIPLFIREAYFYLTSDQYALIKKIMKNGGTISASPLKIEQIKFFQSLGLFFTGVHNGEKIFIIPTELMDSIAAVNNDEEVKTTIRKNTEWIYLTHALTYYYGAVEVEFLRSELEKHRNESLNIHEYMEQTRLAIDYYNYFWVDDDGVYTHYRLKKANDVLAEQRRRNTIDYYSFTKEELLKAGAPNFIESSTAFKRLVDFLVKKMGMAQNEADMLAMDCVYAVKAGTQLGEIVQFLQSKVELDTIALLTECSDILVQLTNQTKQWVLKGHAPVELSKQSINEQNYREPQYRTGGNRRLNVNSHTAKSTIVKGKKIGRNEPCPCGSGKKYKKCCGR